MAVSPRQQRSSLLPFKLAPCNYAPTAATKRLPLDLQRLACLRVFGALLAPKAPSSGTACGWDIIGLFGAAAGKNDN